MLKKTAIFVKMPHVLLFCIMKNQEINRLQAIVIPAVYG